MGLMFYIFSTANAVSLFGIYPSLAFLTPALDVWSTIGLGSFADVNMPTYRLRFNINNSLLFLFLN